MAFVLMIAAAIAGVLGLYGTCMLADSGAYSSGKMMFIHDQLLYRQVNQDLYRIRDWYENESLQTMEAYCREENFLRLRIFWKMVKNPNTGTGILLMDSHLIFRCELLGDSDTIIIQLIQ